MALFLTLPCGLATWEGTPRRENKRGERGDLPNEKRCARAPERGEGTVDEKVIDLRVRAVGGAYTVEYAAGELVASEEVPADALDVLALARFARDAAEGYAALSEAQQSGERLFGLLFGDRQWSDSFQQELRNSESVHLRLDVWPPLLRAVPWELMYDGGYLALLPQVRLSRLGESQAAMHLPEDTMRIVILTSSIPEFHSEGEADAVFRVLEQAQRSGSVVSRQVRYQSEESLFEIGECDVLHVSGYVEMRTGVPLLVLAPREYLPFERLVEACRLSRPSVVYLSARNGTAAPVENPDAGPVRVLEKRANVPAVIGPYGSTTSRSLAIMAAEFYRGLSGRMSLPAAVARARRQLATARQSGTGHRRLLDWTGPVLYQSRSEQGAVSQSPVLSAGFTPSLSSAVAQPIMMDVTSNSAKAGPEAAEESSSSTIDRVASPSASLGSLPDMISPEEMGEERLEELRAFLSTHVPEAEMLDLLRFSLRTPDRRQQEAAVLALGLLGEQRREAREMLIDLAGDRKHVDAFLRRKAVEQLGYIRDRSAVDALLLAMTDPEAEVRLTAQSSLAHLSKRTKSVPERDHLDLPLGAGQAAECIAPLRRAVASTSGLSPRQRVETMKGIEALRSELVRPQFRAGQVDALLEALWPVSPEVKGLAMDLKKGIGLTMSARQRQWALPGGDEKAGADRSKGDVP